MSLERIPLLVIGLATTPTPFPTWRTATEHDGKPQMNEAHNTDLLSLGLSPPGEGQSVGSTTKPKSAGRSRPTTTLLRLTLTCDGKHEWLFR